MLRSGTRLRSVSMKRISASWTTESSAQNRTRHDRLLDSAAAVAYGSRRLFGRLTHAIAPAARGCRVRGGFAKPRGAAGMADLRLSGVESSQLQTGSVPDRQ